MEIGYTETDAVGASYEGVQTDGDCSANLLGNNSQQAFPWLAFALLAQWPEHRPCKRGVISSTLIRGSIQTLRGGIKGPTPDVDNVLAKGLGKPTVSRSI